MSAPPVDRESEQEVEDEFERAEDYLDEEFEDELEDEIEDELEDAEGQPPTADEGEDEYEDAELDEGEEAGSIGAVVAGKSARRGGGLPNPLALLSRLRPANLARGLKAQRHNLQRLAWRLEDAAVSGSRFAAKFALRAARPALVWLVVARAMRTIDAARDPRVRMLRQPAHKQIDHYYRTLLGPKWEEQLRQDLLDAVREVDEGLVTDDVVREKRKLAAVMLRRMEVEEWDKERMRHFYYGLYGMGPWYWDMEERLHNPFFVGARGWNGPIEAWVGENRAYGRDAPAGAVDFREAALDAVGAARGRPVRGGARARAAAREVLRPADAVLGGRLLRGVVDPAAARAEIDAAQAEAAAAAAAGAS